MTYKRALNPAQMTLGEVAYAIGRRPVTIKRYRMNPDAHPFFHKAFKRGVGANSPLLWWRVDVDEYLRETTGRGLPEPTVGMSPTTAEDDGPNATPVMMTAVAFADLAEGIAQALLDVAAKARAGEYDQGARQSRS